MKKRKFFKGVFSLGGELIVRYLYAQTDKQAKVFFLRRIAKEKGLAGLGGLFKVFDGHLNNFEIIEEEEKR
jgi:hypothetical protein